MNLFRVVIELVAKDKASAVVNKTSKSIKQAGRSAVAATASFKNLAGAFTSLVVAGRVRAAMEAIITPARKMETSMLRLGWLTGRTTSQLSAMRDMAEQVAKSTIYGPQESVDAMSQLLRATGSMEMAMGSLGTTTGLAMASFGKMTLDKSTKMVSDMSKAFSMSGDEIEASGDKVMAITKAMGVGVEELQDVMGYLGTAAIRGGQNFEQMLMSFSLARRVLPSSRRAATQLMRVMGELASDKSAEALQKIGIRTADLAGNIRPMSDIMLDLSNAAVDMPLQVRDALNDSFGQAAVKPMFAMLSQLRNGFKTMTGETLYGAQVFKYMNNEIKNSGGAVKAASDLYMETADAGIQRMTEAWDLFKTQLGEGVLPHLGKLAKILADGISHLIDFGKALPGPIKWLLKSAGILVLVGMSVTALRMAWVSLNAIYQAAIVYTGQAAAAKLELAAAAKVTTTSMLAEMQASVNGAAAAKKYAIAEAQLAVAFGKTSVAATGNAAAMRSTAAATAGAGTKSIAGGAIAATAAVGKLGKAMGGLGTFLKSNWLGFVLLAAPAVISWMTKVYDKYIEYTKMRVAADLGIGGKRAKGMSEEDMLNEKMYKMKVLGGTDASTRNEAMGAQTWKEAEALMGKAIHKASALTARDFIDMQSGAMTRQSAEERESILMSEFKKRWDMQKKLEGLKDIHTRARLKYQEDTNRKAKNYLMMGTKPFERAITKLELLTSYEPKSVKAESIVKIMSVMDRIQKSKVGGRVGSSVNLSQGDINSAKTGKKGAENFATVMRKIIAGKEQTTTEVFQGLAGIQSAIETMKATRVMSNEQIKALQTSTVDAFVSQLKGPARASALQWLQSGRGQSAVPGGGAVKGFSQAAGGFFSSVLQSIGSIAGKPTNVPAMFGGRSDLPGANQSPVKAAQIGAAEAFPGVGGEGAQQSPSNLTIAEMLGEQQKPLLDDLKQKKNAYEKLAAELQKLNAKLNGEGIKVKMDEGSASWITAMTRALSLD